MAVLFQSGFPHAEPDDAPVSVDDFPDYPVTMGGSGAVGALTYTRNLAVNTGSSVYVNSALGDRFLIREVAAREEAWTRVYVYLDSTPNPDGARVFRWRSHGPNTITTCWVDPNNKFYITDPGGVGVVWTSANSYLDQWVRLEWRVRSDFTGTTAVQNLRIYSGGNLHGIDTGGAGYETSGVVSATPQINGLQAFNFGYVTSPTSTTFTLAFDALRINDVEWVGPIIAPPVASFTVSSSSGAVPFTVDFTNTSGGALSYLWDFGDGETSTATSPSHTFTFPGSYVVELQATNTEGTVSAIRTITATSTGNATIWAEHYEVDAPGAQYATHPFTVIGDATKGTITTSNVIKGAQALGVDGRLSNILYVYDFEAAVPALFYRTYATITKPPINSPMILGVARNGGEAIARFGVNEHGKWSIWRGKVGDFGNLVAESTAAISHGMPVRIEWMINTSAEGNGTQRLRIYAGDNCHGTDADIGLNGTITDLSIDQFRFGIASACNGRIVLDATALGIQDALGPINSPNAFTGVPISGFRASRLTIAKGDSVTFLSKDTATPTSRSWNFGGAGTSTAQDPSFTFINGGTFDITHTATNAAGTSTSSSLTVTALDPARGKAVPKVHTGGTWKTELDTNPDTMVNVRTGGLWADGTFRVFKDGFWSSSDLLVDGEEPPPPGGGWGPGTANKGVWYGSSLGNPGDPQTSYNAAKAVFGPLNLVRTFDSGFPSNWNNSTGKVRLYETNPEIKVVWHSLKPSVTQMKIAGGTNQAARNNFYNSILTYTNSIPDDVRVVFTCWHEPEQEIDPQFLYTRQDWHGACRMFQDAVIETRAARTVNKNWLKFAPILMGITVAGQRGDPDGWHQTGMDAYGVDAYYPSSMRAAVNYYTDTNRNWGVGEFGEDFGDGSNRDQLTRDYLRAQYAEWNKSTKVPRWVTYWQSQVGKFDAFIKPSMPLSSAYWTALCQTGDPP